MKRTKGGRAYHYREFRNDERKFPRYRDAVNWLQALAGALKKR
jgi:hypothetical protein